MSDLREIHGIGKSIEQDLFQMGIFCVDDLKGKDPQDLYQQLCLLKGQTVDCCMLYVFRCAVHYVESNRLDKQSKWWDFKDEN